ncbi:AGAP012269-PA, partial [Anopheles gambiae str. PEST]
MARQLLGLLILSSVLLCVVAQSLGPNRLTCGKRRVKTIHLVHNGIDAKPGHWPWHAAIFHRKGDQMDYACGGSIIDENTILTAAHCVFLVNGLLPVSRISVHLGRVHLKEVSEFVQEHTVQELIVHPGYNSSRFVNDIALIKLTGSITMSEFVQPVCLWTMDKNQELIVGKTGTLVGFGLNEQDVVSEQLKQASIGVVDALTCIKSDRLSFANQLTAEMFCGGGQSNVSACNGDSGGGLFFNVEGKWFVRGVVSFIPVRQRTGLCDPSKYTAYADVAKYLGWIDQYIDRRVLVFDTDELEVDYEEKLPLFNLNTCGTMSETVLANGQPAPLPWLGFVLTKENKVKCVELIANATLAKWKERQQAVGSEKLKLFNMESCGQNVVEPRGTGSITLIPWIGTLKIVENPVKQNTVPDGLVVLINERYALTSANVFRPDVQWLWVQFGGYVESDSGDNCWDADGTTICRPKTHRIAVERIIVHPQYNRTGYTDDIALVQLATPADVSQPHVQPICLPILDEVRSYAVSSMATVTFGLAHGSFITSKVDRTRFVPPAECQRRWNGMALRLQIERTKQCNLMVRDSQNECYPVMPGFPLHTTQQLLGEQRHFLRGLLALRPELCSSYYPAIYTDVDVYLDWILDSMDERLGTSKL